MKTIQTCDPTLLADAMRSFVDYLPEGTPVMFTLQISIPPRQRARVSIERAALEPNEEKIEARILQLCTPFDGETMGVIYNRMRGKRRQHIDAAVKRLEEAGRLEVLEVQHAKTGKPYSRLRAT